ncbi:MAG TPA: DinB family protein [Gemmatimonadales bacterium]|nr:DinB family protein [Gemmatimonadales bacterium]
MSSAFSVRPQPSEFAPFYMGYVNAVPDGSLLHTLGSAHDTTMRWLRAVPPDREDFRYAEGKWTVREVIGHIADAERVFAHRMLRFARADSTPLSAFEENAWVDMARFERRSLSELLDEWATVRAATLALLSTFDETELSRTGTASGSTVSARGLAWIIAGHELHHVRLLRERYGL